MTLSRKEKNAYWMPYTDNRWFKDNPKLLESAKDMHYTTSEVKNFKSRWFVVCKCRSLS